MLLLIGWRGQPGVKDEPQHVTQGRVQEALHQAIELPYRVIGAESGDLDGCLEEAVTSMTGRPGPYALLIRKGTFAPYEPDAAPSATASPMRRSDAVEIFLSEIGPDDLVVSTTGMTSREVFDRRERRGESHDRDFLTVGSMGHASQIALGLARQQGTRTVYCLDGDGAVLMHMGSLAIIGSQKPANLRHVLINNGAHDSVGGQPTAASEIDLPAIANACGYTSVASAQTEEELRAAMSSMAGVPGPSFLEIRVSSQPHTDAGRPTSTPAENKAALMKALGSGSR
jgi:phosphonopyruvate decarboxylase